MKHREGGTRVGDGRGRTAAERRAHVVRRAVEEIWNQGDLGLADVLFAPGYVNHGGLIPDLVCGPEAIKASVALYRTAFPGFHITVEALTAAGEMVDLQWAARSAPVDGRHRAAPASGGGMLRGTTRGRLVANQIAESWTTWDHLGVLRRLGIVASEDGHIHHPSRRTPVE